MYILFHQHVFSINIAKNDLKCIFSLNLKGRGDWGFGLYVCMSICLSHLPSCLFNFFTYSLYVISVYTYVD